MGFYTKLSNGWTLAKSSFLVLRENKELLLFPVLSGLSLLAVLAAMVVAIWGFYGWDVDGIVATDRLTMYAFGFLFYLVNYFIIVFFNMALIHCTHLYFNGEQPTLSKGIQFSMSRIGTILSWAVVAATVGLILRVLQENLGWLGKIITGIIGVVWSVATFFVVPVLAYEKVGPVDAVKRSASLMREKWGESIGAGFSIGLVGFIGSLGIVAAAFLLGMIHPMLGGIVGVLSFLTLWVVLSAAQTVFISAAYHSVTGSPVQHFRDDMFSDLFVSKKS
jgi:hypothetical protein